MSRRYDLEVVEKNITPLINRQFPAHYWESGPVFMAFFKKYIEWLEGKQNISVPYQRGRVDVTSGSRNVTGRFTNFLNQFQPGKEIALYLDEDDYDIFKVESVANNTFLTIETPPDFTATEVRYGKTKEQYNPVYYARRFLDNDDIDKTSEEFLVYFKEKYLKNIPITTKSNTRMLVKHALDIYRSKGTERSLELLFRLVFGIAPQVYYPSRDLFRLSDGNWYVPQYLEISLTKFSAEISGHQIVGLTSGATAYAEAVVRKTVRGRLADIVYLTNIKGKFMTGEQIEVDLDEIDLIPNDERPVIIGSLTDLVVTDGGNNFSVGDTVYLNSPRGEQGLARVANTRIYAGLTSFDLVNGGYAYTDNAEIYVSDYVLTVANVILADVDEARRKETYFYFREEIFQPKMVVEYHSSNGSFPPGTNVFTYFPNNDVMGEGVVMSRGEVNASSGILEVSIRSGNLEANSIFSTGNSVGAIVQDANVVTSNGTIIGQGSNVNLGISGVPSRFIANEIITQRNEHGQVVASGNYLFFERSLDGTGIVYMTNCAGIFYTDLPVYAESSRQNTNVTSIAIEIGVKQANGLNEFTRLPYNILYGETSQSNGVVTFVLPTTWSAFQIYPEMLYEEDIEINTDLIGDYMNVTWNDLAYGFPAFPSGNLTHGTIGECFSYQEYTIGKIARLANIAWDARNEPMVRIYDPVTARYHKQDAVIYISGADGVFTPGELITQEGNGSRGIVKFANSSVVTAERLRWYTANNFVATTSANTILRGEDSGFSANVVLVERDFQSRYLGDNAIVKGLFTVGRKVTALQVIDSGFGYANDEFISFSATNNQIETIPGWAKGTLGTHGKSLGRYLDKGGFLSDDKKIHDGYYWQEFSYDIQSSVTLDRYRDMLEQIEHVSGTKYFGTFRHVSVVNIPVRVPDKVAEQLPSPMAWDIDEETIVGWDIEAEFWIEWDNLNDVMTWDLDEETIIVWDEGPPLWTLWDSAH